MPALCKTEAAGVGPALRFGTSGLPIVLSWSSAVRTSHDPHNFPGDLPHTAHRTRLNLLIREGSAEDKDRGYRIDYIVSSC